MSILQNLEEQPGRKSGGLRSLATNPIARALLQVLRDPAHGGVQGLIQGFQNKGLGGLAASWIGGNARQAPTPQQVAQGMGSQRLQDVARQAGMPEPQA